MFEKESIDGLSIQQAGILVSEQAAGNSGGPDCGGLKGLNQKE